MKEFKRKKIMLAGLVLLAICVGVINNKLSEQRLLQTSADYVKYEGQQMRLFDEASAVVSSDVEDAELMAQLQFAEAGTGEGSENAAGEAAPSEGAETAAAGDAGQEKGSQTEGTQTPGSPTEGSQSETSQAASSQADKGSGSGNVDGDGNGAEGTENANAEQAWDQEEVTLVSSDNFAELNDKTTYFEEARAALNMDRNEILSMLTEFAEESDDNEAKQQAADQKLALIDYMSKEKTVENLLKNKGFQDAYVVITDEAVNVTINKEDLTPEDLAKVVDVVTRETSRPASQIVVQNKV